MSAPKRKNGALLKDIIRGCTSKVRYPDQITARAAGIYLSEMHHHALYLYPCKYCKGWHLTRHENRISAKADADRWIKQPP